MIRANVYSLEPLSDTNQDAIADGLDLISTHIGEAIESRYLQVKLPINPNGKVNAKRVGYGNLDKMVELHLMAVPLDPGEDEALGLASPGSGVAYIDTSFERRDVARHVSAHETTHALGFVLPDSWQRDIRSPYHCCSADCIMHKEVAVPLVEDQSDLTGGIAFLRNIAPGLGLDTSVAEEIIGKPISEDFCSPCREDLRNYGQEKVSELRTGRLMRGRVG